MSRDDSASTNSSDVIQPCWWPVPAAIGLGVALQLVSLFAFSENLSYLVFTSLFIIWPLSIFLLLLWWTFWSRLSWGIRGCGLLALAVAFGLFVAVFRFDEFDGAMAPKFSFRWRPTAVSRAEQFFKERGNRVAPADKISATAEQSVETKAEDASGSDDLIPTDEDQPQYFGRNRDGVVVGPVLRTDWDSRKPRSDGAFSNANCLM